MNIIEQFFLVSLVVQIVHSIEELSTGFNKKWYVFKMPFWVFLAFEICFSSFWLAVLLLPAFPYRVYLQEFFLALMFANGVQHLVWSGIVKKYVPGLITAPIHIGVFLVFLFQSTCDALGQTSWIWKVSNTAWIFGRVNPNFISRFLNASTRGSNFYGFLRNSGS